MTFLGGMFGGAEGLPPVEKVVTPELAIERRLGEEAPDEHEVVVEIHPTNPPSVQRFEQDQSATPSLAAQAPWLRPGVAVGELHFSFTSAGSPSDSVAEKPAPVEQETTEVVTEVVPRRVRAERFKPGEEILALDIERANLRAEIGDLEGALAALEDEVAATPILRRQLLVVRSLRHKKDTELQLARAQAQLAKKESRRTYLLSVRDGLRKLGEDQEKMGEIDFDDWVEEKPTPEEE